MAITKAYFSKQPLYISQSKGNNGIPSEVYSSDAIALENAIAKYEKQFLAYLLGKELAKEFLTTIDDVKWDALKALLYDSEALESPIANYIYFWYLHDHSASYNGETFKQAKPDSSVTIQVVQKQVQVWGEMKETVQEIMDWIVADTTAVIETTATADYSKWSKLLTNYNSMGI